jgi:hypothetical protein
MWWIIWTYCVFVFVTPFALATTTSHLSTPFGSNVIIFDGDSLVAGFPQNAGLYPGRNTTFPYGTDFPSVVSRQLGGTWLAYNVGVSVRELATTPKDRAPPWSRPTQLDAFDQVVAPLITQAHANGLHHVIVVNGGEPGNMLYFCTLNKHKGGKAAQDAAYSALKDYAAKVHTAGALFVDITMPARVAQGAKDTNLQSDMAAVNQRITQHCRADNICDAVIDLAADPRMQDPSDARYYIGGVHFTDQGYRVWAEHVLSEIRRIAGTWPSVRPDNPPG